MLIQFIHIMKYVLTLIIYPVKIEGTSKKFLYGVFIL